MLNLVNRPARIVCAFKHDAPYRLCTLRTEAMFNTLQMSKFPCRRVRPNRNLAHVEGKRLSTNG